MRLHWNDATSPGWDTLALERAAEAVGIRPGHRVGILAGNTPLAVHLHQAARRKGWTLAPLHPQDPQEALAQQAKQLRVDAWVCTRKHRPLAMALREGKPVLACDSWGNPERTAAPEDTRNPQAPMAAIAARSPAFLVQTSGTSGQPHAVEVTWEMLDAHAVAATRRIGDGADAVWACVLPLQRIGGIALVHRVLRHRGTLYLEERFEAARLATLLRHRGVTHASLVPTMLGRLLSEWGEGPPPRALGCLLLGGDAAPEGLVQTALARRWPIWCTYGLTEASSQVATARPEERRIKPGTSGRPLDGVRIQVRDDEIILSGSTIAGGGPLATGDLGRLDADGFLFVAGRKDDRITTGGVKVDPETVEQALLVHPDVLDACVVGVPDKEWGHAVVASLVLRDQAAASDWKAWCAQRLPAPAVPKGFRIVDSLPRTEQGKLRRAEVRRGLEAGAAMTG